ncbi:monovalent cation/H+ antiporter subunit D [Arhodomonas aquaeolei]|uniref:monovalent cation/H+ antiporter subunit D n=1 Tax=Arhodomonas aquaeolei TaxID=2369 RepID=UPI000372E87D|nr:monovalent cation/H+ antiporter subunit D [Arhodomonas aquaeolei]
MTHLPILPVLIAAFAGFVLVLIAGAPLFVQRVLSVTATAAGLVTAIVAVTAVSDGSAIAYALGDWPAPYGIVLVLDRLSALMVLLTAVIAMIALLQAIQGTDRRGRLFHALYQFQLMGIYGAFLTGDIFNLFVFFEILLIASYGLLLHGHGPGRTRAAVKYVVINLVGSALFLVGVGTLYAVAGSLNIADLAGRVAEVAPADRGLLYASAFLLVTVFAIKAALVPLSLWLPDAYAGATTPVAALFAIMTKIGVYAILRVYTVVFDAPASAAVEAIGPWLLGAALATIVIGMTGSLAAAGLRRLVAYAMLTSVGTMVVGIAVFTPASIGGGLYYLLHSTIATAGMFLLAGVLGEFRGDSGDRFEPAPRPGGWATLGLLFTALAVAVAGLPPLSGFLGKTLILQSVAGVSPTTLVWPVVLAGSLFTVVALSRAGSALFWKDEPPAGPVTAPNMAAYVPAGICVALVVAMTVFAGPISGYTKATAGDLLHGPGAYTQAVMDAGRQTSPGHHDEGA